MELGACMRELHLEGCDGLKEFLETSQASFFEGLSSLEVLDLQECTSLENLSSLSTTLQKLRLNGCTSLRTVNASLPNLQALHAAECTNLERLPREIGACMRELSLKRCDGLEELIPTNQASFFGELSSLEILDLRGCTSLETLSVLPTTLQKLWLNGCSSLGIVKASLPNLRLLDAEKCTNLNWLSVELGACMRELHLEGCDGLKEFLETSQASFFEGLSSLEVLDLQECTSLENLSSLSTTLQKLRLNGCTSLRTVNASLPNLQALHAAECTNLERLPREIGACMRELSLKRCDGLEELIPTNQASFFGGLSSLEVLDLQECTSLENLSSLSTTLQKLRLNGCTSLRTVNASLPNLQALHAAECTNLERLPREIGACMRELSLKRCDGLEELIPTNQASFFGELSSLEILDLRGCTSLETLSVLPTTLQKLWLNGCSSLGIVKASLPNLRLLDAEKCTNLNWLSMELGACMRELHLEGCDGLKEFLETSQASFFEGLSSLEVLDLQECTSLENLSSLSTTLQKLRLNGCTSLRTVNASLPNLQALHAAECTILERLPREIGACMRELSLKRCDGLEELIPTNQASFFGELSSLEILDLRGCTSLETLSVLPTTLQKLWLNGCSSLGIVKASLPNLRLLDAEKCTNLNWLSMELGACMRELHLEGCDGLKEFVETSQASFFEGLSSLEVLDLQECTSLENLSSLSTTLLKLRLNGCTSLRTVNASLPNLQALNAAECTNLERLPREIGACMRELSLKRCDGLEELIPTNQASFFGELSSLEILDLRGCTSLETLSVLPTTLQKLWLNGCSSLGIVKASLPNLRQLDAEKCTNLKWLSMELGACMRELYLEGCDGLKEFLETSQASFFEGLSSLEVLDLQECTSLENLSSLSTTLQKLRLNGCTSLRTVNASLPNLQALHAAECTNLERLPREIGACMRELSLKRCDGLEELIPTNQASFFGGSECGHRMNEYTRAMSVIFGRLSSLEVLDLQECTSLETLSFLSTTLQKLRLNCCTSLRTVNVSLPNLQALHAAEYTNLERLPREIGDCMRQLSLKRCDGLEELIPSNQASFFGELSSLEILDLRGCTSLETLSFLPTTLQKLWLNGCSSLGIVKASLPKLRQLDAEKCTNLKWLSMELGACMRELYLEGCDGLKEFLETSQASFFEGLSSLEVLDLQECTSLETLSFLSTTLQKLRLNGCTSLRTVNASLPNLQALHAAECTNLERLPREIGACMRELGLKRCDGLEELIPTNQASFFEELSSLEILDLRGCTSLETLSFLPTTLQKLWLNGCSSLGIVKASLPNLRQLDAEKCTKLKWLSMELGACMRELYLEGCDGLKEFLETIQPSFFEGLSSLEVLDLQECTSLETLSLLSTTLQKLRLNGCTSLRTLNASLPYLQALHAAECTNLERLSREIGACMRELILKRCDGLEELIPVNQASFFGGLSSLEVLDLQECTSLETLSFLSTTLQKLRLNGCTSLRTVNASLPNLQALHAAECTNLERLPREIGACMRELSLKRCDGLEELIPANQASFFGELSSLEILDLRGCTSLETLSFLPTTLQKLWLNGCSSLGIVKASLPNLRQVDAEKCTNLKWLSMELGACMRELHLEGCDGLKEFPETSQASFFEGHIMPLDGTAYSKRKREGHGNDTKDARKSRKRRFEGGFYRC
ncbi:hypothetical protein KP509_15G002400 [Ceratopteris richardii]|uniref:Uncharacterized protein n=1 Tax=Ceratopteris richardii TaxID=49495 RepID=A0A8T2T0M7_CERRI|nr:hypothetical protein KP509_15G002400 [Ceratopteris richardii]KAH7403965.1 hypothetical protein KP509_15G002400 [Ceratopteris richardii]